MGDLSTAAVLNVWERAERCESAAVQCVRVLHQTVKTTDAYVLINKKRKEIAKSFHTSSFAVLSASE